MNYLVLSNLQHNGTFYPQHSVLVNDGVLSESDARRLTTIGVLKEMPTPVVSKPKKAEKKVVQEVEPVEVTENLQVEAENPPSEEVAPEVAESEEPNIEWGKRKLLAYAAEHGITTVSELDSREVMVDKINEAK